METIVSVPILKRKGSFAYLELAGIIRSWIAQEKVSKGEKLPTEDEFMKMFNVGRHTVRSAISDLVEDGLVERFPGRGTFVRKLDVDTSDWRIRSLEDIIDQNIPEPAELMDVRSLRASADPEAARALGVDMNDSLLQLIALRRKDNSPFTCSKLFVPKSIGDQLGPDLKDEVTHRPLVRVIERKCGLRCARAVQRTMVTTAGPELSKLLEVPIGGPLFTLHRTYYTSGSEAFEHVRLFGVPELYSHTVEFSRANRD